MDLLATWARQQVAHDVFRRFKEALDRAGVRVLPVKGIVTGRLLYGDPAERPIPDIDVRIVPRDLPTVVAIARGHGWRPRTDSPRLHEVVVEVDGWEIDVECALGPPGLCATTIEQVLGRASVKDRPFTHFEPELHDHALLLVLNSFKDGLRPMPWSLEDLRRIVRQEAFDASLLIQRANEGAVLTALWLVADWLSDHVGALEWRAIRERIGPRPPSSRVAGVYRFVEKRGWSPKLGLVATAMSSDATWRSSVGLGLAALGIARRRFAGTKGHAETSSK
jgi:hypothetical protein